MEGIRNVVRVLDAWWQFFDYCLNINPAAAVCESFWHWLIGAFVAIGAVAFAIGIIKYLDYRRKYYAALRAQWERDSIDEAGIQEAQWNADKAYSADIPQDEVLGRIKAALEARRQNPADQPRVP